MKRVLVLFIVGVVLFGACSAQNANAQNANIAQRIIGTWVDHQGTTWVFNANGNLTKGGTEYKFGVADTKLAISDSYNDLSTFSISISSDGRTLIIDLNYDKVPFGTSFWLTKR